MIAYRKIGLEPAVETKEILHHLEWMPARYQKAAVDAAVARREEITPELLRILGEAADRAEELEAEEGYMGHLYAMFLLAQFRETRAYPLVVRFASLPGDLVDSLCGDFITEDLGQILASVCGGDLSGIQSLIENDEIDEWVRGAAAESLLTLVAAGATPRAEVVAYLAELFHGKLTREYGNVWDALVSVASALYPAELMAEIEQAYEDGLVDPGYIGFDEVEADLAAGEERVLARLAEDRSRRLVENVEEEMAWWACFRGEKKSWRPPKPDPVWLPTAAPVRRTAPKTGRNDPCPCGSGKKFKKCCGG